MAEPLKDELLSAYLDDALSASDRERVERHLAANPEARQLVGELQVLRQSLRSLPQYKLPAEFRDQVLRQAERAMLTQPVDAPVASHASRKPKWLLAGGYRALAWPAAVLAVAIMLMVVYREQPAKVRSVARVDRPPTEASQDHDARAVPELHSWSADKGGGEMAAPPRAKEDLLKREDRSIAAKQPADLSAEVRRSAAPALAAADDVQPQGTTAAKAEEAAKRKPATPRAGGRPSKRALDDASHNAARYAGGKAGSAEALRPLGETVDSLQAAELPADRPVASKGRLGRGGLGQGVLLVQVDVSRRAAKAHAFEKLLERQRIVPQQQGALQQQMALPTQAKSTAPDRQVARSRGVPLETRARKSAERGPALPEPPSQGEVGSAPAGDVKVFYAEATASQVQAALEDLKQRGKEFPALAVQPDPSQPRQTQFAMFRRGNAPESLRRDLAYWKDQVRLNLGAQPSTPALGLGGYGGYGYGEQMEGTAGGVSENGELNQRGGMAAAPLPPAAGAEPAPANVAVTLGGLGGTAKSEPGSRPVIKEEASRAENGRGPEERDATAEQGGEASAETKRQAVARSREGYGSASARQHGERLRDVAEQPVTGPLQTQQVPPPSAAPAPAGQSDRTQTTTGSGERGRQSVAEDAARPLQVVFLLRVVESEAAPVAESKSSVPPEPAAAKPTPVPKPSKDE